MDDGEKLCFFIFLLLAQKEQDYNIISRRKTSFMHFLTTITIIEEIFYGLNNTQKK